jgi:hypothetical protein
MADNNFIAKLSKLTGMDKDAVLAKLEELGVDEAMAALDAAGNGNAAEAKRLMSGTTTDEDDENDKNDLGADINPLFRKTSPVDSPNNDETPVEDKDFGEEEIYPNVGDTVKTRDGHEGNVKIPNGPRNTVGVMIGGKLKMQKRRNLKIEEHVMGMTGVMDLSRMRELAGMGGMMTNGGQPPVAAADNAMGSLEVPAVEVEVEHVPTIDAAECPLQAAQASAEPVPASGCAEVACDDASNCMSIDDVMNSFDQIERALPELKVKDAREIRQRVNTLMSKLNESRFRKI